MSDQLSLAFPSAPVDTEIADLLALIDGDPLHADDRAAVISAIVAVARENDGVVDPNLVRARLGTQVYPRVVGSTYCSLRRRGALAVDGWIVSRDARGRNTGKPCRRYRLQETFGEEEGADELAGRAMGTHRGADACE